MLLTRRHTLNDLRFRRVQTAPEFVVRNTSCHKNLVISLNSTVSRHQVSYHRLIVNFQPFHLVHILLVQFESTVKSFDKML